MISVRVPRPLWIPESGEITPLYSFRKAVFLPFTLVNGLATIVATRSLQLGAVSSNSAVRSILVVFYHDIVVVAVATIAVVCQSVIFGSLTLRKARALDFGVKFNFSKI